MSHGADAPQNAELFVRNGNIITMDDERRIIADGAIAIDGNRIAAVGDSRDPCTR